MTFILTLLIEPSTLINKHYALVSVYILPLTQFMIAGIPESKLWKLAEQYTGLFVQERLKVGGNTNQGYVAIGCLSGAIFLALRGRVTLKHQTW